MVCVDVYLSDDCDLNRKCFTVNYVKLNILLYILLTYVDFVQILLNSSISGHYK